MKKVDQPPNIEGVDRLDPSTVHVVKRVEHGPAIIKRDPSG